ncbi:MAG: hypothetical protein ACLQDY_15345 [Streptosporangiaceae bacterium]
MLPPLNLPVSLLGVLMAVRPCFTAPSFTTFFATAGIVVALPFCSRSWCLPVLARRHLPGQGRRPGQDRRGRGTSHAASGRVSPDAG